MKIEKIACFLHFKQPKSDFSLLNFGILSEEWKKFGWQGIARSWWAGNGNPYGLFGMRESRHE